MLPTRLTLLLALSLTCVGGLPAASQTVPQPAPPASNLPAIAPEVQVAALTEALKIGEVIEIMRQEGIDYGASLETEMFPGRGGARWQAVVGLIYDTDTMRKRFDAAFAREIGKDSEAIGKVMDFFASERGQRILDLELDARRALMDDSTEEAARIKVEDMIAGADPRMEQLRAYAEANDLIELNVVGALNSNLAFFKGMVEGKAFEETMTEEQMLSDVWGQEPDIRAETEEWLFPYLALAYGPLPDKDLADYVAFSKTPAGRKMNAATFAAFDAVFTAISHDLGRAAARQMQGEDI